MTKGSIEALENSHTNLELEVQIEYLKQMVKTYRLEQKSKEIKIK